jgi:hypothetical protein
MLYPAELRAHNKGQGTRDNKGEGRGKILVVPFPLSLVPFPLFPLSLFPCFPCPLLYAAHQY